MTDDAGGALEERLATLAFSGDVDARALHALLPVFATLESADVSGLRGADDVSTLARGLEAILGARAAAVLCDGAASPADVAKRVARLAALLERGAQLLVRT